jgi:hypothetical protein
MRGHFKLDVAVPSFETSADGFLLFTVSVRLVRSWIPRSGGGGEEEEVVVVVEEEEEEEEEEVRAWVLKKRFSEFKSLHSSCMEDAGFRDWIEDGKASAAGIGNAARVANVVSAAVSSVANKSAEQNAQASGVDTAGTTTSATGAAKQGKRRDVDLGALGIVVEQALSEALTTSSKRRVDGLTFPTATLGVVKLLPSSMTGAWVNGHYEIRRKALSSFLRLLVGGSVPPLVDPMAANTPRGTPRSHHSGGRVTQKGSRSSELTAAAAYAAASTAMSTLSRSIRQQAHKEEQQAAQVKAQRAKFEASEGYETNRRMLLEFYKGVDPTKVSAVLSFPQARLTPLNHFLVRFHFLLHA